MSTIPSFTGCGSKSAAPGAIADYSGGVEVLGDRDSHSGRLSVTGEGFVEKISAWKLKASYFGGI